MQTKVSNAVGNPEMGNDEDVLHKKVRYYISVIVIVVLGTWLYFSMTNKQGVKKKYPSNIQDETETWSK